MGEGEDELVGFGLRGMGTYVVDVSEGEGG